ncbi:pitrilysin family protein [Pseudomonas sp. 3A(2025)]
MNEFSRLQSLKDLAPVAPSHAPNIQQWLTAEGARVLFVPARELPMVDIRLDIAAGSCRDDTRSGAAFLTMSMLNEGVPGLDAQQIAQTFEGAGARFNTHLDKDHAIISLRCLSAPAQREVAVATFASVVGQPDFTEAAIKQVKGLCSELVDARERVPRYRLQNLIYRHLFAGHPYGYPRYGDRTGIASLTREDLQAFHQRHYTSPNTAISLVGDLSRDQAQAIAAKISAQLPRGPATPAIERPSPSEPEVLHIATEAGQALVIFVLPGILRHSPDHAAMTVANDIFGADTHSRIYQELRIRHGLSYSAGSSLVYALADGRLAMSWQCSAQYNSASQDRIEEMLKDYVANGPTEDELNQSKQRILNKAALAGATNQAILMQLATLNAYRLPINAIEQFHAQVMALTQATVKAAIQRNVQPRNLLYASIGPDIAQVPLPALP